MIKNLSPDKHKFLNFLKKIDLSLIILIFFSIGFIPFSIYIYTIFQFFKINQMIVFFLFPIIIYFGISILILFQILINGILIRVFNIKYKTGVYKYNFLDKNSFKWILYCSLYTPCRKIIEIFPVGYLKIIYYKLLGMKIGKNSLIGGVIKDPCITFIGDNVTMGEYSIIYGHMHNYKDNKITIQKVIIGNNCIIGAGSIIMPGAILEDDVVLASGAVVTKNQTLKKGKTYGGIPAKEIKEAIK